MSNDSLTYDDWSKKVKALESERNHWRVLAKKCKETLKELEKRVTNYHDITTIEKVLALFRGGPA